MNNTTKESNVSEIMVKVFKAIEAKHAKPVKKLVRIRRNKNGR